MKNLFSALSLKFAKSDNITSKVQKFRIRLKSCKNAHVKKLSTKSDGKTLALNSSIKFCKKAFDHMISFC
jgi:hypothetical protein